MGIGGLVLAFNAMSNPCITYTVYSLPDSSVSKYCNTKLENREGYFSSPGFPQYYPHLEQCGWTISSSAGQTILLKILHLHLRPATEVVPTAFDPESLYPLPILGQMVSAEDSKCDVDSLTILEGNVKRASVCGEGVSGLKVVEMESGEAEVNFKSATFNPASGFLMYYKSKRVEVFFLSFLF